MRKLLLRLMEALGLGPKLPETHKGEALISEEPHKALHEKWVSMCESEEDDIDDDLEYPFTYNP